MTKVRPMLFLSVVFVDLDDFVYTVVADAVLVDRFHGTAAQWVFV